MTASDRGAVQHASIFISRPAKLKKKRDLPPLWKAKISKRRRAGPHHIEEESLDDFVCFLGLPERLKSVLQRQPEADQKLFLSGLRGGRVLVLHGYINFGAAQNFQKNLELMQPSSLLWSVRQLVAKHSAAASTSPPPETADAAANPATGPAVERTISPHRF